MGLKRQILKGNAILQRLGKGKEKGKGKGKSANSTHQGCICYILVASIHLRHSKMTLTIHSAYIWQYHLKRGAGEAII